MKNILLWLILLSTNTIHSQDFYDSLIFLSKTTIYFESDSFNISPSQQKELKDLLVDIEDKDYKYSVRAHTDDLGTNEYNDRLSEKRAKQVKTFLIKNGVTPEDITSKYHGEVEPLASNNTVIGRAKNRRATVRKYTTKKLQWLTGVVIDTNTNEPIQAHIRLHGKSFEYTSQTDDNGTFRVLSPIEGIIGMDIKSKGYLLESKIIRLKSFNTIDPIPIKLEPISIGKSMYLNRVYFKGNMDLILAKSFPILKELEWFMKENPLVCIEIGGHINAPNNPPIARDSRSYYLSIARARAIYAFLDHWGINSDRMVAKGYGNWEMLYPKATLESQMAQNRRVEITILNCEKALTMHNDSLPKGIKFSKHSQLNLDFELIKKLDKVYTEQELIDLTNFKIKRDMRSKKSTDEEIALVSEILDTRGWIGPEILGTKGSQTIFHVIYNADLKTQEKYLPMLKTAVTNEQAGGDQLAMMIDRCNISKRKKQVYGSQIGKDSISGHYYILPIKNPSRVDELRAKVGLNPIQEYVRRWNIRWNIPKHIIKSRSLNYN